MFSKNNMNVVLNVDDLLAFATMEVETDNLKNEVGCDRIPKDLDKATSILRIDKVNRRGDKPQSDRTNNKTFKGGHNE